MTMSRGEIDFFNKFFTSVSCAIAYGFWKNLHPKALIPGHETMREQATNFGISLAERTEFCGPDRRAKAPETQLQKHRENADYGKEISLSNCQILTRLPAALPHFPGGSTAMASGRLRSIQHRFPVMPW